MSDNIVTFYHSGQSTFSARPILATVEVEGLPAPWLEVIEITRSKSPKLNQARFKLVKHPLGPQVRFESMAQLVQPGQNIHVNIVSITDTVTSNQMSWPLFSGVIIQGNASIAGDGENVEVLAVDYAVYNNGRIIDSMQVLGFNGDASNIKAKEIVFNPDGRANRSATTKKINGRSFYVFDCNESTACYWNYATAIQYIVSEYLTNDVFRQASLSSLEQETAGQILRDIDITGLSPLVAIERLCQRAGLHFGIAHVPAGENETKEILQFYRRGKGRRIFLRHQVPGLTLNLAETNLSHCSIKTVSPEETIQAIGQGDIKRYESTFELAKGWDPALEINNYELYSPTSNDDFIKYKDVFRKWVLNEAGDYSGQPYNQGDPYDLSRVFGNSQYSLRRRRFWPCLSSNPLGKSFGYYVEVSYNSGNTWQPYAGAFNVILDECGIYISSNQLDGDLWIAITGDYLLFRITASIDSDQPLEAIINDGPINSSRRVRSEFFNLGNEYKYRQISSGSLFHNNDNIETGLPDTIDDTENMRGQLRDQILRLKHDNLSGTAELAWIHPDIWPGDIIKGISGRELDFTTNQYSTDCMPQVDNVKIKFEKYWTTTITF